MFGILFLIGELLIFLELGGVLFEVIVGGFWSGSVCFLMCFLSFFFLDFLVRDSDPL